jgi:hypothetical protein
MNIAADPNQVWPGMRIHIIDIVHPPGMSIPPDIEAHMAIVTATAMTNVDAVQR